VADDIPAHFADPARRERWQWVAVFFLVLAPALYVAEFKPWLILDRQSLRATGQFLHSFWPPAHSEAFLGLVLAATWKTIAVATCGVFLALLIALPAALIGTRALSVSRLASGRQGALAAALRGTVRWVLILLRSIPELVWGLLFVRAVGLGDTAGVLAIALTFGGMIGKVFLEIFESQDARNTDILLQAGAGRMQAFAYGVLPQAMPEMVSYTVFRWECAIRSSVILGFVGAGGLGQQMDLSMKMLAGGEVIVMLAAFMLLVFVADAISKALRRALS
jgi:phosphonate transport system permease protein